MSKSSPYPGDELPSYTESITSPHPSPATLPQNITQARNSLVSSLITTHIAPHLYSSSLSGLSSTTLVLVPSNVSSLHPPSTDTKDPTNEGPSFRGESIEGFYNAENLTIIRLQGRENSVEFWRQPAVVRELAQQLRTKLRNDGHRIVGDEDVSRLAALDGTAKARGGLLKKKSPSAEWKIPEVEGLADGGVRIEVDIREICLRVENEMGLYETRTGKAVVVKVDAGI
ncbi:hypothetical protein P7C71_g3356, partial [Lecanoromycetidae sp. Uapishka_2]